MEGIIIKKLPLEIRGLIIKNFILFFPDESPPSLKTNAAKSLLGGTPRMSCDESFRKVVQNAVAVAQERSSSGKKGPM